MSKTINRNLCGLPQHQRGVVLPVDFPVGFLARVVVVLAFTAVFGAALGSTSPAVGYAIQASPVLPEVSSQSESRSKPQPSNQDGSQAAVQAAVHERIVLLGDGLIEQAQYSGWIELMMTASQPEKELQFRNIGWNGDTPTGKSRTGLSLVQAGYEPPGEGWRQLVNQIEFCKPTTVVLGYGMACALEGQSIEQFTMDYEKLVLRLKRITPAPALIHLSPLTAVGRSKVTPATSLEYAIAIEKLAEKNGDKFVNLTTAAMEIGYRKDSIHLNDSGYRQLAIEIQKQIGNQRIEWQTSSHVEKLREAILQKNRWWFHRSRPANMAYVFGFRKREQGQNAAEIPEFYKLVERDEKVIAGLKRLDGAKVPLEMPRKESLYAKFQVQPRPTFTVADGLEVTLWAENPLLNKPIQMNFDPQGRLWIASSETYPMIEPGQSENDKIVILEDSNGDGTADRSTVFADGLLIPTGVLPVKGGAMVAQSTDLLLLQDTDGDGKADTKKRVLSGFGTEDTHHNLHTLMRGPDGRIYMNQSVYTRTDTELPDGVVRMKGGGGFRFSDSELRLQPYFRGLWNSWGHQFDQYGQSFVSDGAGYAGLAYVFPGAKIRPTPGAKKTMPLISPGRYPKFCSGEIIHGDSYPVDWQGSFVTCDFRANRVTRFKLISKAAGYVTEQQDDLLRTSESSFRPIDVKQGPDGALYVADWSNPIINHGEVDFRDPRRDRWHGRIWRISCQDRPAMKRRNLSVASTSELLENLLSGDRYLTDQSRVVLMERVAEKGREKETRKKIVDWISQRKDDGELLQGLWLSQATFNRDDTLLKRLLESNTPEIRAAAVRVLRDWADPDSVTVEPIGSEVALELFRPRIVDGHPRVRLEAVRGLAILCTVPATELALNAIDNLRDPFLDHAIELTINENAGPLLRRMQEPDWKQPTAQRQRQLEFVLASVSTKLAARYLDQQKGIPTGNPLPWIKLIGKSGSPTQLKLLIDGVEQEKWDAETVQAAIQALVDAKQNRNLVPAPVGRPARVIRKLLGSNEAETKIRAIQLAGAWQVNRVAQELTALAGRGEMSMRRAAITSLGMLDGDDSIQVLRALVDEGDDSLESNDNFELRRHALTAMINMKSPKSIDAFFTLAGSTGDVDAVAKLWRTMLSDKKMTSMIAKNLPSPVPMVVAQAGVRAAKAGGRHTALVEALLPFSGMNTTSAAWGPEQLKKLQDRAGKSGNAARGEQVYFRPKLQCVTCHRIGGVGGKVGPDMTSLGASAPIDYIIESLIDPNAKIKENYHAVVLATLDGKIVTGIEAGSTAEEFVLRDAEGNLIRVLKSEVDESKNGKSLMPAGLLDAVEMRDQADLVAFLSALGKPGEFDASRQNVARAVEIFAATHRSEQKGNEDLIAGRTVRGWKPLQTRVNGEMTGVVLKRMTAQPVGTSLISIFLRTKVRSSGGKAKFEIAGIGKAELWIDGAPVKSSGSTGSNLQTESVFFETELNGELQTLLVRIDGREIPDSLSIESNDVTFVVE